MPDPHQIAATMPGRRTDYAFGLSIEAYLIYEASEREIRRMATTDEEYDSMMKEMVKWLKGVETMKAYCKHCGWWGPLSWAVYQRPYRDGGRYSYFATVGCPECGGLEIQHVAIEELEAQP